MKKLFPTMSSKPENSRLPSIVICWLWAFIGFPVCMSFFEYDMGKHVGDSAWLEIGYHVLNGVILLFLIGSYLKDEWFMVTTSVPYYLKHITLTVGLMVGTELVLLYGLSRVGFEIFYIQECFPMVEMAVCQSPFLLVLTEPVFGTIALSIFAPISICALFYCFGFAPMCSRKPFGAYLCIVLITLLPPVLDLLRTGTAYYGFLSYIVNLPIHLLACWSYQKTDNVWTPIVSLAITNLLSSVVPVLLLCVFT